MEDTTRAYEYGSKNSNFDFDEFLNSPQPITTLEKVTIGVAATALIGWAVCAIAFELPIGY